MESLRILQEKTLSSDFNQIDEENIVEEPNGTETGLILVTVLVLVVAFLLLMDTWDTPFPRHH